jgi:hypothetical protein
MYRSLVTFSSGTYVAEAGRQQWPSRTSHILLAAIHIFPRANIGYKPVSYGCRARRLVIDFEMLNMWRRLVVNIWSVHL